VIVKGRGAGHPDYAHNDICNDILSDVLNDIHI
jgi:hypothetical protein